LQLGTRLKRPTVELLEIQEPLRQCSNWGMLGALTLIGIRALLSWLLILTIMSFVA
jgi:hypothetical protein